MEGALRLRAANSSTATICSRVTSDPSTISSTVAPDSSFSNTVETGMRVSLNTHAPLRFPGMLSNLKLQSHHLIPRNRTDQITRLRPNNRGSRQPSKRR